MKLNNFTIKELKEKCQKLGIKGYSNLRKHELINKLRKHSKYRMNFDQDQDLDLDIKKNDIKQKLDMIYNCIDKITDEKQINEINKVLTQVLNETWYMCSN